jgi:hypothetical protein
MGTKTLPKKRKQRNEAFIRLSPHEAGPASDAGPDVEDADGLARFKKAYAARRANALECGRSAFAARCRLGYGEFSRKAEAGELPLAKRTMEMWMVIGEELGNLDANDSAQIQLEINSRIGANGSAQVYAGSPSARHANDSAQVTVTKPSRTNANDGAQIHANGSAQIHTDYTSQLPSTFKALYWLGRLGRAFVLELIPKRDIRPSLKEKEARVLFQKYKPEEAGEPTRWSLKRRLSKIHEFVGIVETDEKLEELELAASKFKEFWERLERKRRLVATKSKSFTEGTAKTKRIERTKRTKRRKGS